MERIPEPKSFVIYLNYNAGKYDYDDEHTTYVPYLTSPQQKDSIYKMVSSYFTEFKVVFIEDSNWYNLMPADQRLQVYITGTEMEDGSGGFSLYEDIKCGYHMPAVVSAPSLLYEPKTIADAVAHEIGHMAGLRHHSFYFGIKLGEYDYGDSCQAPIMGCSYYSTHPIWTRALDDNYEIQDDYQILYKVFLRNTLPTY